MLHASSVHTTHMACIYAHTHAKAHVHILPHRDAYCIFALCGHLPAPSYSFYKFHHLLEFLHVKKIAAWPQIHYGDWIPFNSKLFSKRVSERWRESASKRLNERETDRENIKKEKETIGGTGEWTEVKALLAASSFSLPSAPMASLKRRELDFSKSLLIKYFSTLVHDWTPAKLKTSHQPQLYFVFFCELGNVSMLTYQTKMVNIVNIIPAKHQHVNTVVLSMLACRW